MGGPSKVLPSWEQCLVRCKGRCHLAPQLLGSLVQALEDKQSLSHYPAHSTQQVGQNWTTLLAGHALGTRV